MNKFFKLTPIAFACAIVGIASGTARAQIGDAVVVGNLIPATDVLGRNLPGINGQPNNASRVEIREFGLGIVVPPASEAEIDAANPLVRATYLGHDVVGTDTGLFSETITDPANHAGKTYYARVYDAPTADAAVYFADSLPVGMPSKGTVTVVFQPVSLVSGEEDVDTDGDGIPDWMERELGTLATERDTDGDGYPDGFEVVHDAYLHPNELDSAEIRIDSPEEAGEHTAVWWSIPTVAYRLEYTDAMTDPEVFVGISNVTAATTNLAVPVGEWVTNSPMGFFRWAIP